METATAANNNLINTGYETSTRTSSVIERPPFSTPESILLSELNTDKRYAFGPKESLVKQIISEGWNPLAAGYIKVNQRLDGTLWILDGYTRVEAARKLGHSSIWAVTFNFTTVQEEAYWARRWNIKLAPITALERYRAALEAGDPSMLIIDKIVKNHGYRITNSRVIDYSINAVNTLEKIYHAYGDVTLDLLLEIISRSWEGESESTTEDMLKAVLVLIVCYAETLDEDDLVFRLAEHKAAWWRREAEADRGNYPLFVKLSSRFVKAYNHYKHSGFRGGKLPNFMPEEVLDIL